MSVWTITWLCLAAAVAVVEGVALANKSAGDTLSEHFWRWLRVQDPRPSWFVWALRGVVVAFLAWLAGHLALGWFTPTHPWPW